MNRYLKKNRNFILFVLHFREETRKFLLCNLCIHCIYYNYIVINLGIIFYKKGNSTKLVFSKCKNISKTQCSKIIS